MTSSSLLLLVFFQLSRTHAQELRLDFQRTDHGQAFELFLHNSPSNGHTFIEFSSNAVWYPAYYSSSNSTISSVYSVTNAGRTRLFRALQGATLASQVKASWERLGVTNYVFEYTRECLCASMVSGRVTVMGDKVVKIENARNSFGEPIANPRLSDATTINRIFEAWLLAEPKGGYARELIFDLDGFPRAINIDIDPRAADEEEIYRIQSFTPLP